MELGRFSRLRHRRRSKMYAVKETIAALNEELEFTLKYAHAMSREENYQAAAEVIEEQRRSLARASNRMQEAVVVPEVDRSRFRARAALAGVAATLAIASGAVASLGGGGTARPEANTRVEAFKQATQALTVATAISDPVAFEAIALQAQDTLLDIAKSPALDPALTRTLLDSVEQLRDVARDPSVSRKVREQARRVVERVQEVVIAAPEEPDSPEAETETETHTDTPAEPAPAPTASV